MIRKFQRKINKLLKHKDKKLVTIMIGVVLLVVVIVSIVNLTVQRTYNSYSVIKTKVRTDTSTKGYMRFDGDIVKYSDDGITLLGKDMKAIWSASYSFKNPSVVTSNNYIAVADVGGKEINVYDKKGNLKKISNTREICQIEVSDTGMVAILGKEERAYYISVVNATKKYIDIKTRMKEDGYPLDMAFSQNSKKLVTSYVSVVDGHANNDVTFYNFGEVGKNYQSKMVKADSYGEVMVPKVEFMDEDTVSVFSQERVIVYDMKELPEEKFKSEKYTKMIRSVICDENYVGIIVDDEISDMLRLDLYSKDGRKRLTKKFKFDYDKVEMVKEDIILSTRNEAMIIRTSGKVKFNGSFKEEVDYILPYNNVDKFIFVTPQNIQRVRFISD